MAGFARNTLTLTSGNFIAQIISVGLMPVITRVYDPAHFGVFSLYLSIVMVLFPVATLRFNSAIMLPKDDEDGAGLLLLSWLSVLVISLFIIPATLWVMLLVGWNGGELGYYIWLIPAGVAILGCNQAVIFWALRKQEYKRMSLARVSESIVDRSIVLGLGTTLGSVPHGLIAGRLFGPLVSLVLIITKSVAPNYALLKKSANIGNLKQLAIRYKDFPLYSSWSFLANAMSRELPTILLAILFTPVVAGFYGLGMRVMNMPMMLIGDAIAKAFMQKVANQKDDMNSIRKFILDLMVYKLVLMLPFALAMIFFGDDIFAWIFGDNWYDAGKIVQIMMLVFVCLFIHRILSALLDVFEKQKQRLALDMVMLTARGLALGSVALCGGDEFDAIWALSIVSIVVYLISFKYILGLVSFEYINFLLAFKEKMLLLLPVLIGFIIISEFIQLNGLQQIFVIGLIMVAEYLLILLTDARLRGQYYTQREDGSTGE